MDDSRADVELSLLQEIAKWTREGALPAVRDRVVRLLDSDQKKRVYEAADGSRSYRALEAATGVNRAMISQWMDDWEQQRIVDPEAAQPLALFKLRELGIPPATEKAARPARKDGGK